MVLDPKFYENDFEATGIEEIEFVRSPLYDYAKGNLMQEGDAHNLLDEIGMKISMTNEIDQFSYSPLPDQKMKAFFRYRDEVPADESVKHIF